MDSVAFALSSDSRHPISLCCPSLLKSMFLACSGCFPQHARYGSLNQTEYEGKGAPLASALGEGEYIDNNLDLPEQVKRLA